MTVHSVDIIIFVPFSVLVVVAVSACCVLPFYHVHNRYIPFLFLLFVYISFSPRWICSITTALHALSLSLSLALTSCILLLPLFQSLSLTHNHRLSVVVVVFIVVPRSDNLLFSSFSSNLSPLLQSVQVVYNSYIDRTLYQQQNPTRVYEWTVVRQSMWAVLE